jgi:hypothetical protein
MGDYARLEAVEGGVFSVDINGVLIRGHFVRVDRPRLLEIGRPRGSASASHGGDFDVEARRRPSSSVRRRRRAARGGCPPARWL